MPAHPNFNRGARAAGRPAMPTSEDEWRAQHQWARLAIMLDDYDWVLEEWLEDAIGAERSQAWGIPDTSSNFLRDASKQLTTPGLYGKRWTVLHTDQNAQGLVGEQGLLEEAGWFSIMAFVQYLTIGLGDMFVALERDSRGGMIVRLIVPSDVYLVPDENDPARARAHWEIKLRWNRLKKEKEFVWDVWDLGRVAEDGTVLEEPSFRVLSGDDDRKDVTGLFFDDPAALRGEFYPWRTESGRPIIPRVHYQNADAGMLWNWTLMRGATIGTLNSALYWTYAGHCARDATGSYVIIAGLDDGSTDTIFDRDAGNTNQFNGAPPVRTKIIEPGTIDFLTIQEGVTPFVQVIGPGMNLPDVVAFARTYEEKQAVSFGLPAPDATRKAANPTSAAALSITNEQKRDFSGQVASVFRKHDLEFIELGAVIARAGDKPLGNFPGRGYSIQYKQIPRTPTEQREFRDDLDWRQERGLVSSIDVYRATFPGTTEADAIAALMKVAEDQAKLEAAIGEPVVEGEPDASLSTL